MKKKWLIYLVGTSLLLVIAAVSCGEVATPEPTPTEGLTQTTGETVLGEVATPKPTPTNGPTQALGDVPTPEPPQELTRKCATTVVGFAGPVEALRGKDPVPTGFDPVNSSGCTFNAPISSVSLELLRQGERAFHQEVTLDPPSAVVGFPLSEDIVSVVPADMEPGRYDRRVQVTSTDGQTIEIISDGIWVFDPAGHPPTVARQALAKKLGVALDVTFLTTYEPETWSNTSLGCPEPGKVYAEVVTPGFRLVFIINTPELWGPLYEYHTNLDGSMIALCEEPETRDDGPTTGESLIEFVMKDTYALSEDVEIRIRNNGDVSYVYSQYYPACNNLTFYDDSGEARRFERMYGREGAVVVELSDGLFIIPEGT